MNIRNSVFVLLAVAIIWGSSSIVTATHIFTTSVEDAFETMISSGGECCEFDGTTSGQSAIRANMLFISDNTLDIGASGANRPRDLFLGRNLALDGDITMAGSIINDVDSDDACDFTASDVLCTSATGMTFRFDADNDSTFGQVIWQHDTNTELMRLSASVSGSPELLIRGHLRWGPTGAATFDIGHPTADNNARDMYSDRFMFAGGGLVTGARVATNQTIIDNQFLGTIVSDGASNFVVGTRFAQGITGANGDTASIVGAEFVNNLTTQNNSETIVTRAQVRVSAGGGTIGGTDTVTNNVVLYVDGPPSGSGTNNHGLWVDGGSIQIEDVLEQSEIAGGDTPVTGDLAADAEIAIFSEADCLVFAFNNGGTMTFVKLALDGSDTTWVQNTTDPTSGC